MKKNPIGFQPSPRDSYQPPRFFRMMTRYRAAIECMSDTDAGQVLKSLLQLADTGERSEPKSEAAKMAVEFIRPDIVADMERARKISAARSAVAEEAWKKRKAKTK